jgi:thioredoxin-like negative regulator of GroEL
MIELLLEAERAMAMDRVDRADELYQQVVAADPRSSIAVVGLARVALERGDQLGSYLLARRALAIDPENDAARRLAQRLEEVLAMRGQPVPDPMTTTTDQPVGAVADVAPSDEIAATDAVDVAPEPPAAQGPSRRRSLVDRLRRR